MEVFYPMFCESCGTVLNAHGECINCEKKRLDRELETKGQPLGLSSNVVS